MIATCHIVGNLSPSGSVVSRTHIAWNDRSCGSRAVLFGVQRHTRAVGNECEGMQILSIATADAEAIDEHVVLAASAFEPQRRYHGELRNFQTR